MKRRPVAEALDELATVSADMRRLAALQARRRELLLECRQAEPPVPVSELAAICGTSTVAINVALSKKRKSEAAPAKRARSRAR